MESRDYGISYWNHVENHLTKTVSLIIRNVFHFCRERVVQLYSACRQSNSNESDTVSFHIYHGKMEVIPGFKHIMHFACYLTHPGIAILTRGRTCMQACLTVASHANQ